MTLPRGIQEIKRKNAYGSIIIRYRVQIKRKSFKQDKLFDDKEQAIEFLNASKSKTGQSKIKLIEDENNAKYKQAVDFLANPSFSAYIKKYLITYIYKKFEHYDPATAEGKIKLRNLKAIKSFYNTIKKTKINCRPDIDQINPIFNIHYEQKEFGQLKPLQITEFEINEYVKARLKMGIKPISVQREITFISNVFRKLKHLDYSLRTLPNPCLSYDRDLLHDYGNLINKKSFRMTDEDREKLFKELDNYSNPEMGQIVKLMLLTALRRSEAVLLKWDQIKDNYILLTQTKSNRPRTVYLIPQAKELIASIPKREGQDRLFTYTVLGFDGSYNKFLKEIGLPHFKSHALRKESISNFIEQIGAGNSLLIAEFLGLASVRKLEENIRNEQPLRGINTQDDLLRSVGHTSPAITQNHYFSLKK